MAECDVRFERQDKVLVLDSGRPRTNASFLVGFAALLVMFFLMATSLQEGHTYLYVASGIFLILFMCGFAFAMVSRRWVAEFDTAVRRLKISRLLFGRTSVIVNCPFDECHSLGTTRHGSEGQLDFGLYIQLKNGGRHKIVATTAFGPAAKLASQLSAATGIPRFDAPPPF
jgi:hypothetical protein